MNNNSTDKGLTVVIPVRNRENLVIRCLDSVKRQTLRPLNVIVVDNGSTDGTWKAVEGWIARNAEPEFAISPNLPDNVFLSYLCKCKRHHVSLHSEMLYIFFGI